MRDKRWVREHRGGTLTLKQHKQLMKWSMDCVNHLLISLNNKPNEKIENAIIIGNKWVDEKATTGDAMKASREILNMLKL